MLKTRHLSDLYLLGKEEVLDDGTARGAITVWVQKLNTTESESARRKADAQRARVLSLRSQPDSDAYLAAIGDAYDSIDPERLVETILGPESYKRRQVRQSEVAFEDEWSKEGYLQGLRDLWLGGMAEEYALDPEDPEALRVLHELTRFEAEVTKRLSADLADQHDELLALPVEELQQRVAEQNLQDEATRAWMREFRMCTVWHGVRLNTEKRPRYFDARAEVNDLQQEALTQLFDAIQNLTVDPLEGKDSPETLSSSPSSEQLGVEEMEELSGLAVAAL